MFSHDQKIMTNAYLLVSKEGGLFKWLFWRKVDFIEIVADVFLLFYGLLIIEEKVKTVLKKTETGVCSLRLPLCYCKNLIGI